MKNKILLIGVFIFLAPTKSLWAADIFGNWIVQTPMGLGTVEISPSRNQMIGQTPGVQLIGETFFSFKAYGTKLTGTISDSQGETAITEGKINGDDISFVVARSWGKKEVRMAYKGKVFLNEIKFTCEIEGGTERPQEFIAKREFQRNQDVPLHRTEPVSVPLPPR
jgi:hypothetical protein